MLQAGQLNVVNTRLGWRAIRARPRRQNHPRPAGSYWSPRRSKIQSVTGLPTGAHEAPVADATQQRLVAGMKLALTPAPTLGNFATMQNMHHVLQARKACQTSLDRKDERVRSWRKTYHSHADVSEKLASPQIRSSHLEVAVFPFNR